MKEEGAPPNSGGGFGPGVAALVWLCLAGACGLILLIVNYFSKSSKKKKEKSAPTQSSGNVVAPRGGVRRRGPRMQVQRDADDSDDAMMGNDQVDYEVDEDGMKVGAKKARKLEMKAEKKAMREAELQEREDKKKRDALLEVERKKDEERRLQAEAVRAEEERIKKEEQEKKEYEEYLKLKESFVVEESGEVGILTEEESQSLLQEFIDFIKTSKVVQLEDLGARFNLKTQEAIDRLENLLTEGRLTGVMDDRGKFIYISEDELKEVAKFIKQRGRISIAELAESSNSLINMEGVKSEPLAT